MCVWCNNDMNCVGLQWKKSLQCRSAKALSPIGTPSEGIRNKFKYFERISIKNIRYTRE